MKKTQTSVFILTIILCAVFSGCDGMATLFHGPKPAVTYTVTFNANGASGIPPETQTVNAGTVISLPDKGNLSSAGNIFVGWSESSNGTGTIYSAGSSVTVTRNMVFYAQWLDGSTPQYTVTFNANGATGGSAPAPQTVYSGISITIPGQGTLVYSGKVFGGWNTQANGGGTNYAAGATYTVTGHVTLYAKWQSAIQYTVTYNANGASGTAPATQTVDPGTVITLPGAGSMTYIGRTFEGWNTSAGGTGTSYAEGESYTVNANASLYARWVRGFSLVLLRPLKAYYAPNWQYGQGILWYAKVQKSTQAYRKPLFMCRSVCRFSGALVCWSISQWGLIPHAPFGNSASPASPRSASCGRSALVSQNKTLRRLCFLSIGRTRPFALRL